MTMTVAEYAKHLDMALHLPSSTEADIRAHAEAAAGAKVAACYTNSSWTPVVAEVLAGSGVHVGSAISFPYGATSTAMKIAEIDEALEVGATAIDMVVNIGELRAGNHAVVEREVQALADRCAGRALSKVIYEVCYLTDQEIVALTAICCDAGVDYVKTATGSQGFPTEHQARLMKAHITNPTTKLKISGIPRTFSLPVSLYMIEELGADLIGTRSAASLVDQYRRSLAGEGC